MTALPARDRPGSRAPPRHGRSRPVVLGTLSARFDREAEWFAIETALDVGAALLVVNVIELKPYPCTMRLFGPSAATLPEEEDLEPVRATAARAAALGLPTELLRVTSLHPARALLEVAAERDAGLLVFGPEPDRVRRRTLTRAFTQVCERAPCLIWASARVEAAATRRRSTRDPRAD